MSVAKVLRLEDYRGKKANRLQLSDRLYGADPKRLEVFRHLVEVAELCSADRAATVWVDEYGPGSVHPHVVLDPCSDLPRRFFSSEPLRRAWELGVPGAIDAVAEPMSALPTTFAISLGSDGMRAWFLIAESAVARPLLEVRVRDRLMFLAGECAAILLHRELDRMLPADAPGGEESFAGWPILRDLEGRESDEELGRRIAQRFVVGRVIRMVVDDDLVIDRIRVKEQVRRARIELPEEQDPGDPEGRALHAVLDGLESADLAALAEAVLALGEVVERQEHAHGALELYACAYEIGVAVCGARVAAEAARRSGRLLRRRAARDHSAQQYVAAADIAEAAGLDDISIHAYVGLALLKQDAGNLPAARAGLEDALSIADSVGDADSVALVHHSFMGLEQVAGDTAKALEHGWVAIANYDGAENRTRCMASLAGVLLDHGDRGAAEDAWTLVAHQTRDRFYLTYAHDALAHLAALRGDAERFAEHAAECDALGWEEGSAWVKAEVLFHRGLSYRALGELDRAEQWLRRALGFAEEHGYNQMLFRAEETLESLADSRALVEPDETSPAAPAKIREGLRSMRRELAGVGAGA